MKHYLHTAQEVVNELNTSFDGLTQTEAEKRLNQHGENKLAEAKKASLFSKFLAQLANPMIIVLLIAAAINLVTVIIERMHGSDEGFAEFFIIVGVVLLNAILGVVQEGKAEQAIEALKQMTASTCKVLRDGNLKAVKNQDLTIGDVVILEAGDSVPADCRIIECASLKCEEAALTGESVPVNKSVDKIELGDRKDVTLGDRENMLYMGSTVVYGRAKAVVTAVGMQTEMGKIAGILSQTASETTPLQKKLNSLSKTLSFLVLGICVVIFIVKLLGANTVNVDVILDSFIIAISLAVAAIPEGLATVVTIVLSIGMTKMAKNRAVVKKLTAVETLGCTQIICSDKTGTLTQNKMTVVEHFGENEKLLATAMAQCSDAVLDKESKEAKGEPTECALVNYAYTLGLDKNELDKLNERVAEAPFDSMRKMMTTLHSYNGNFIQYTKGAPDVVLSRCTKYLDNGEVKTLDETAKQNILKANKGMADRALRVLAAAYVERESIPSFGEPEEIEQDLIFIGLTGMIDPVRPEVKVAISECKSAGIRAIMITGDHKDTAVAIAKELGIVEDASQALTGAELDEISDEEFEKVVLKVSVYARVQPEHKVRIVKTCKKLGYITAMTGDGVNDAPSIKNADIGIGMGITGTDVTKGAADMVLQDDNFATIVSAVGEGRKIYENIRKAVQFLLSSNLAEVISIFIATLLGFTLFKPIHLLWINLITDTFPALALGVEEGEADVMKKAPRKPNESIFAGGLGVNLVIHGLIIGLLTLTAYIIGFNNGFSTDGEIVPAVVGFNNNPELGMTMAFLVLSLTESFHSLNARSINHSLFSLKKQNKWLWGAFALSIILSVAVVLTPGINTAFSFVVPNFKLWLIAIGLSVSIIPIVEITKVITNAIMNTKK